MQAGLFRVISLACSAGLFLFLSLETGLIARAQSVGARATTGGREGYVDSALCRECHQGIWQTYQRTGMGRSFYRPSASSQIEDDTKIYFHAPSATYYAMVRHDGKLFQRQYQLDFDSKQTNVSEAEVDYVIGSGNHSRTYLHRTARNTLIELPLAWYSEKGGYWAMNPGYDRPDHQGRRRLIGYDCMFCHNSYPDIPAEADRRSDPVYSTIREGIDCQRCHGPAERHVALAARPGTSLADVRAAIVNPARLAPERQREVCLQCHLETTSFPLPNSIVRFDRAPFSYRPGEPLGNFMLHFDQASGHDQDDRFEIAGGAYRLERSKCFQESHGALQCTTCHNPHDVPRGEAAARHYTEVCHQCHSAAFDRLVASGRHTSDSDCIGCHMPKRRTGDVVHVVMTDHYIQRQKPTRDLVAEIAERPGDANPYRGEVVLYYPKTLPNPADELYLAVAQVAQQSNLAPGIERLAAAIEKYRPASAEFYLQLADAWRANGKPDRAIAVYEEALRHNPKSSAALQNLALAQMDARQPGGATATLERALDLDAKSAATWDLLGVSYLQQNQSSDAVSAFEKATQLDPQMPEAYNSLGGILLGSGDLKRAEPALRQAIALDPNYAQAHNNLANLLAATGRLAEARYHFDAALRVNPINAPARYDYAVALARAGLREEAGQQLETALKNDPNSAESHEFLGTLLAAQGQLARAIEHYRRALSLHPDFARASLHLGESLADSGDTGGARIYLERAASSTDRAIRQEAQAFLAKLNQKR